MEAHYSLIVAVMLCAASAVHAAEPQPPQVGKANAGRWQIHSAVYGLTQEGKVVSRSENTVLLDTETGKTWLLWPTKDVPYSWIELPQRKDAANVRKAE